MPNGKYSIELGTGESTKYGIIFVLFILLLLLREFISATGGDNGKSKSSAHSIEKAPVHFLCSPNFSYKFLAPFLVH
jgi:hypothetical protein